VSSPLLALGIHDIVGAVTRGEVSAAAVTDAYLDAIAVRDPSLHCYLAVAAEPARTAAAEIDARRRAGLPLGRLAGAPLALKDLFVTQGLETTAGSRVLGGWRPPYDGTHAHRLRGHGAVLLGKVTLDEFAMGSTNENSPWPAPRNPWNVACAAGGSSGGSAAAVAAGLAAGSLGSDTGGSVRQPASLCGVVGIKPTYGRVSRHGMVAFASSLDQAGPLARTVADAALLLECVAGHDPLDATSLAEPPPRDLVPDGDDLRGRRVGVLNPEILAHAVGTQFDPEVLRVFRVGLEQLRDAGATLVDVELPHLRFAVATYYILCAAEASSNLARYDGVRYGRRVAGDDLQATYRATREDGFGDEVKRRILLGTFVLRAESWEAYYGRALKVRTLVALDHAAAFERCDAIASPVTPVPAYRLGAASDPLATYLADVFTVGANLAGLPAVSVPAGFASFAGAQVPVGLQLVGARGREAVLLRCALACEARAGVVGRRPPEVPHG
jgi:aspartyl-tRNA(Asn)/glutamyl-tRNA(Gln) amidotransferase subunit A